MYQYKTPAYLLDRSHRIYLKMKTLHFTQLFKRPREDFRPIAYLVQQRDRLDGDRERKACEEQRLLLFQ